MKKLTVIDMHWTETGAVVNSTTPINCPRCDFACSPHKEHRCGDQVVPEKATPKKATKKKAVRA